MSLDFVARFQVALAVASALLVGTSGLGLAQQQKKESSPAPAASPSGAEKVSGVILTVEKFGPTVEKVARGAAPGPKAGKVKGAAGTALLRVSINTNAVWRDWARDQAQVRDEATPKKDAAKGANSVATTGQPADENSLVVIDVAPETRVETRFRSPTDETSKGVKSPEKVKSDEATSPKVAPAGNPVQFRAEDLQPGLFVEAEFRESGPGGRNRASTVTVIRPIKVLDTSPAAPSPPK